MIDKQVTTQFDLQLIGRFLAELGTSGFLTSSDMRIREFALALKIATNETGKDIVVASNQLFALGPARTDQHALRRVMSLYPSYRNYLLVLLRSALNQFSDDESLGKTLEQLDALTPELLHAGTLGVRREKVDERQLEFNEWTRYVWQSPDAVTLLSKVLETPSDFAELPKGLVISVGFGWLEWDTPPIYPAPAPWADTHPLKSPLDAVRHPFWGALVATLDACSGDYEWQSLILRGDLLRSFHRTIGKAQIALDSLWRSEFGLYPVDPLVVTPGLLSNYPQTVVFKTDGTGRACSPWLKIALDHLHRTEIAIESEGSWRLTDRFRTQLMKDDEHMMAFEAIRQRSYRLARSATRFSLASTNEGAAS